MQIVASGIGSWPGTEPREAIRAVRDLLVDDLPYLPELPGRGPGADMIGRAGALLEGLHVETQPYGWRLVDRPGADEGRAAAYLRQDLDELAEAYDGWSGPLKVQVCGPWTLAATLELTRGERAVSDPGARRDLVESLGEGVAAHLADLRRLVPGAQLTLQLDEPALPAVLEGRLPTQSGYGRLRAVDRSEVRSGLRSVLDRADGVAAAVHSCAPDVPVGLIGETGVGALALDLTLLDARAWDEVAALVESGRELWAGVVPSQGNETPTWQAARRRVVDPWRRIGLGEDRLAQVRVTPSCGLAGLPPSAAVGSQRLAVEVARSLTEYPG
ncbi:methionine synthase [Marihabitans asiaticum]|uniref:Methionine synthase II (Cobalamin-independent) n=1 Tax=Marihabitans asiaticum TaxID=415218 RepID=A0A560W890_9MICO|nr:methionine synthase [Marihabitans asiaticum]TWD13852.1 methionine synthase II (cobalamin-independent) [Marihabitans asiaticum]